ncbi:FG-GAP repeat domain-containing protein [Streptomyces sp. NPDC055103]
MHKRITGTRLATAVTAVLAVTTLGAGTLATAPAAYAAPVTAPAFTAEESGLPVLPVGSYLDSVGTTGVLSYSMNDSDNLELLWTPYDNGIPTKLPVGPNDYWYTSGTDVVAMNDIETQAVTLRNMATPAAPGVTIDLGALDGYLVAVLSPTSVLAEIMTAEGAFELHIVTKNGDATTTSKVEGLPTDVSLIDASAVRSGAILVAYETGSEENPISGRAVIDVASSSVLTTYDVDSEYNPTLQLTDSHVGWIERDASSGLYMTTVDRATGARKQTRVGDLVNDYYASLVGGWLVYGTEGSPAKALNLTDGSPLTLGVEGSASVNSSDGSVTLDGSNETDGTGLFRITAGSNGAAPVVTKTMDTSIPDALEIQLVHIADSTNLDATGGKVTMGWTLSRTDAYIDVTITNTTTDATFTKRVNAPASGNRFTYVWDGSINGVDAPNGEYAVEAEAYALDDPADYAYQGWLTKITRNANVHDYDNNGSTDLLVRDSSGVLWRQDLRDRPVNGLIKAAQRTQIGTGWNTYKHIEAVGNVGGAATGDLLTVDSAGVLWNQLGKGDGTFAPRRQLGTGWGIYNKITGGSDLTNDGKPDLVAVDTSGAWWLRKGTGDWAKPFGDRVKMGTGWNTYNQIVATGNIAGGAAGDLVGRDTSGVLWLHLGKGDGTFAPRVKIGGGWNVYSQLVAAGDVDSDGRLDLYAYGSGGSVLYRGTGSYLAPFTKTSTSVFTSELTKFTSVS